MAAGRNRRAGQAALPLYFLVTFVSSWLLWHASGVLDFGGKLPPLDQGWLTAQIGVFCPSLWGLAFTAAMRPDLRRRSLLLLAALFLPAALLGWVIARQETNTPLELTAAPRGIVVVFSVAVLAVLTISRRVALARQDRPNRGTMRWSLGAALQLPLFFVAGWLLIHAAAGEMPDAGLLPHGGALTLAGVAVLCAFDSIFGGALGEEIGWRGFALPRLLECMPPRAATLLLGVLWALWHLPIDLAGGFGPDGAGAVIFRLVFTGALNVIVTWYWLRSGCGILTAYLIHATLNWLPVLGFSRYEESMALLLVPMLLFAALVFFRDPVFIAGQDGGEKREAGIRR